MADRDSPLDLDPFDVSYPRALLGALAVVLVIAVGIAASTSAAAFGAYNPAWDGASDLREAADAVNADSEVVLNTSRYSSIQANSSVAIIFSPDQPYTAREAAAVRRFVQRGGTLVVAEDFGPHSNALLQDIGVETRVDGAMVRDERHHYRAPALPVARNISRYPLMNGVDALTLNHGTTLRPGNATVIARTSEFAYRDTNRNAQLDDTETMRAYPVATVAELGDGRVIVVSDPSLFINAMFDRPGNRQFIFNLLGAHDRAFLDYSHAARLPPLALAVVVVRQTPLLQVLVGLAGLAVVGALGRGVGDRVHTRLGGDRALDGSGEAGVDAEALTAYLRRQHPEWDAERVRRVTKGVITHRDQPRGDE